MKIPPEEVRRRRSECDARRESNDRLWRQNRRECELELAALQALCPHENVEPFVAQYTHVVYCQDCRARVD